MQSHDSWFQRLCRLLRGRAPLAAPSSEPERPSDVTIVPAMIVEPPSAGPRTLEDWRDLLQAGRRVIVSWSAGAAHGGQIAHGEVRLVYDEAIWVWLDQELADDGHPLAGQALQILAPRDDALRTVPGCLIEESRGRSLQIAISGRVSRVQRREDVRAKVSLPPVSAVRFGQQGEPVGLLGLRAIDLSAGGIRVASNEPLRDGERLRLVLRLDDREPLSTQVEILVGGLLAQGRFGAMPERDRQRIVQYIYQQELSQRKQARCGTVD